MAREHGQSNRSGFEEARAETPSFAPASVRITLEGLLR
jgi:hypothetical protein